MAKKRGEAKKKNNVNSEEPVTQSEDNIPVLDSYDFKIHNIPINIRIMKKPEYYVPEYNVNIPSITPTTKIILENIRKKLIEEVNLGIIDITTISKQTVIESEFRNTIIEMVVSYFPNLTEEEHEFLEAYLVKKTIGLGDIELLMGDKDIEEIAVNGSNEPVWVYHKKHGWLITNILLENEQQVKHYASMIGRKVGKQITILEPLMDANLDSGDRVNATLEPISIHGHTITIRKFAAKPWTITDFIATNAITYEAAALIWTAIQYEMSLLIAGGTASGKTSMLNVISNFFPPNQRVISIEDTREIQLPKFIHWVPMVTRLPNPEGKGEISMLDLMVNSLRMRPDRILVGEIRRKKEAEILFEAIHTGHSVYATVHANDARETVTRLTNPPIDIPKTMLPALSMIIVQYRNRRTGNRRTFQMAEILPDSQANVVLQYNAQKDKLNQIQPPNHLYETIELFSGLSKKDIDKDMKLKVDILKWLVKNGINTVDEVGTVIAEYYTNQKTFWKTIEKQLASWKNKAKQSYRQSEITVN